MAPTGDDVAGQPLDARVVRTRNDILRAALDVLTDQGLDAVTHHHLAEVAGYSRATIYKHWPTRNDLLRDAFAHRASAEHHVPTGDLRSDLIAELTMFRRAMERQRLDRALATLAALTASIPELAEVRDKLVTEGERILRQLLAPVVHGTELEAAMLMLSGSVLHSALMHGQLPSDDVIAAVVDLMLRGLDAAPSLASLADYRRGGVRAEAGGSPDGAAAARTAPATRSAALSGTAVKRELRGQKARVLGVVPLGHKSSADVEARRDRGSHYSFL